MKSVCKDSMASMLNLSGSLRIGSVLHDLLDVCEINFLTSSVVNKLKSVRMFLGSTPCDFAVQGYPLSTMLLFRLILIFWILSVKNLL